MCLVAIGTESLAGLRLRVEVEFLPVSLGAFNHGGDQFSFFSFFGHSVGIYADDFGSPHR